MRILQRFKAAITAWDKATFEALKSPLMKSMDELEPVLQQAIHDMENLRALEQRALALRAEIEKSISDCPDPTTRDQMETILVKMDRVAEIMSKVTGTPYTRSSSIPS